MAQSAGYRKNEVIKMPTIDMIATGVNIRNMRIRNGLTVADVQAACGFGTPQAVFKWQRGDTLPTVDNLVVLAALFGVTIDEILVVCRNDAGADGAAA